MATVLAHIRLLLPFAPHFDIIQNRQPLISPRLPRALPS